MKNATPRGGLNTGNRHIWFRAIAVGLFSAFAASPLWAATVTLKTSVHETDFDWTSGGAYVGDVAPSAGDTVVIPEGVTAKVVAGTDSYTLVSSLARVTPKPGAQLRVTVSEGSVQQLDCAVSTRGEADATGALVKDGAGELELTSKHRILYGSNSKYVGDYLSAIRVEEGTLKFLRAAEASYSYYHGKVDVAADAVLYVCPAGNTHVTDFTGSGIVRNDATAKGPQLWIDGMDGATFYGTFEGEFIPLYIAGKWNLFNAKQTFGGSVIIRPTGVFGVGKLSESGFSVFGTGNPNLGSGATLLFCGTSETSSDSAIWTSSGIQTLDGGAFGGVTWTGKFQGTSSSKDVQSLFILTGSNTTECVLNNQFVRLGDTGSYQLTKRGTGIWRLSDYARTLDGMIAVENGTLRFDSIAEKGATCALGTANLLYEAKSDATAKLKEVPYAFLLGGDGSEGVMEYTGTTPAFCSTRPFAIHSSGRITATGAALNLSGVSPEGAAAVTLTLDGACAERSSVTGLSDGTSGGRLDVVKEGSGDWRIKGHNTATGSLVARGGRLIVTNPGRRYRWYRIWFTENAYGSDAYDTSKWTEPASEMSGLQFAEIALFDAEGHDLVKGFKTKSTVRQLSPDGDYREMDVGEVAYGRTTGFTQNTTNGQIDNLFDGKLNTVVKSTYACGKGGIRHSNPDTWVPFVVRLPDNAAEVVRIDIAQGLKWDPVAQYAGRNPAAFQLDASWDGLHWDEDIASCDQFTLKSSVPCWLSNSSKSVDYTTFDTLPNQGFVLSKTAYDGPAPSDDTYAFSAFGAMTEGVLQFEGDPMTISGLVLDPTVSAGQLQNVALAEAGTVRFVNVPAGTREIVIPAALAGVTAAKNAEDWSVTVNGRAKSGALTVADDGTVTFRPSGSVLLVR